MIIAKKNTFPLLKINAENEHVSAIKALYNEIKVFSLSWLAEEELELRYPDHHINKNLIFARKGTIIEVLDINTLSPVAEFSYKFIK